METWSRNGTNMQKNDKKNRMKEDTEERCKRKLNDENYVSATDISHSISPPLLAFISASISAKEMTSSRCVKLGARPKWTAQRAPTQPRPNCGDTAIPPWRHTSLWRITTTKTVEGRLSENTSSGSKKKSAELCEIMKKHAMKYAIRK